MARGWESKSVEEQMADAAENPVNQTMSDDARRGAVQERAARARQRQELDLQRDYILAQRTSNAGRRAALEAALVQVEAQIQALG